MEVESGYPCVVREWTQLSLGVTNRESRSRLQLPFELVERAQIGAFDNNLLRS